jgi:glycosyltransferase involved in cell wall biosynthesis
VMVEDQVQLSIEAFGPQPVEAKRPFNVQPDGESAMWLMLSAPPPPRVRVIFDGVVLPAGVNGPLVTAVVPPELTAESRDVPVWIETEGEFGSKSRPINFEVRPARSGQAPAVRSFGPQPLEVSAERTSSIWLRLSKAPRSGFRLMFGETELPAVNYGALIRATVPPELTERVGNVRVTVETGDGDELASSEPIWFRLTRAPENKPNMKRLASDGVSSKRRPKVSVLLITYNHGKYIAQAIESVLMQKTSFPVVINIIDDCSTDGTAEIVMDYAVRYPGRVVACLNKKNIGSKVTQKNFAKGFATLDGEYWALLEGDDYWTSPDKLQRQVDFLEANADFVICAHNTVKVYEDGSREPHRFLYYGKKDDCDVYEAIMLRMFFHTTGVLYRNIFNGVPPRGYDNRWSCDIYIFISHAAHGKIHHIDEDMAVYVAHGSGLFSTMSDLDMWKYNIGGLVRYNAWLNFRFNRFFAEGIMKFCNHLLAEAGKNGVAPLTPFDWLKYTAIRAFYRAIYRLTQPRTKARTPSVISRFRQIVGKYFQRRSHRPWSTALNPRTAGDVAIISASRPGHRQYVTGVQLSGFATTTSCTLAIHDGTEGHVLWEANIGAGESSMNVDFRTPLRGSTGQIFARIAADPTSLFLNVQGFEAR